MKKTNLLYVVFTVVGLFSLTAYAQSPASPSMLDLLTGAVNLIQSWKQLGLYAGIAAVLKLLIDGLKPLGLWDQIPEKWQSLSVVAVSALTVGLASMAAGASVPMALGAVFSSAAGASLIHEILKDVFGWGA